MNTTKYVGNQKTFYVPKKRLKLKKEVRLLLFLVIMIICILLFFQFLGSAYTYESDMKVVHYNETGNVNYRVYLLDNDTFLYDNIDPNQGYISDYIDYIRLNYEYRISSESKINFDYNYEIISQVVITKQNEPDVILSTKEAPFRTVLKSVEDSKESDSNLVIQEEIDISYDLYDDVVDDFKNTGVAVDAYLEVVLKGNATASDPDVKKALNETTELLVKIPLSEQTVVVDAPNPINNNEYFSDFENIQVTNNFAFSFALIFAFLSIVYLVLFIKSLYEGYFKKDIYTATIRKYLREYDRLIVSSKQPNLDESTFANKIRVMSIEELIDAHDSTGQPIIYYEVVPDEKSYFIIINGNTFYKLTISKKYLEEHKKKSLIG